MHHTYGLQWERMDQISKVAVVFRFGSLVALTWTLCYFPIRLLRPRPLLSEIVRQPGMIACSAVCLSIAFGAILSLPGVARAMCRGGLQPIARIVEASVNNLVVAHAIAGAWLALRLSGAWKSEPGWIDAMGCTLGFYWIIALVFLNFQLLWL